MVKSEQFIKASDILKSLRDAVTREDRKAAIKELRLTDTTISCYLNGHTRNLDTAERLIIFFRGRITRRDQIFSNHE